MKLDTETEKAMARHSSTLAWNIPWTEEPGRVQSMGLLRVGHDWSDLAAVAVADTENDIYIFKKEALCIWLPLEHQEKLNVKVLC